MRTNEVRGAFSKLPQVGEGFVIVAEPLDRVNANMRLVQTSPVQKITGFHVNPGGAWKVGFVTDSGSTYELEFYTETDEANA